MKWCAGFEIFLVYAKGTLASACLAYTPTRRVRLSRSGGDTPTRRVRLSRPGGGVPVRGSGPGGLRRPASLAIVKIRSVSDNMAHSASKANLNGDSDLVAKAQGGDSTAFAELVRKYERKIFRLAKNITNNQEDAEDVLQEAFLKAYSHIGNFQGNSKFYTWLVRIAVNEALMKLRKRKSDRSVSLDEGIDTGEEIMVREVAVWEDNPEQRYSQTEIRAILDEAVASLRPAFRTVFVLRDIEELSTEETATMLDLSIPAVKSRLLRARLQLREKLTRFFRRKGDDVFAYL